jgi:uncharacterized protein (TIGR03000 family)
MYSMVLMMAMSASPEAAAFGNGCNGCGGGACYGNTCHGGGLFAGKGCCGGGCHGGGLFAGHGCSGSSCHGCHGGGGLFAGHGCCGGGGCHGGGLFGRKGGCHGGCYGGGCYGGGCTGYAPAGCCGSGGCQGVPPTPMPAPGKDKKGGVTSAPAYITVNVPADATITIDGAATKSTSNVRIFATPELEPGTVYYYTFVAEVVRDGKKLTAVEKVAVEAGSAPQVSLTPASGELASK